MQVDFKTLDCCFLYCCDIEQSIKSLIIEKHSYLSCPVMALLGKSALSSFQLPLSGTQCFSFPPST